MQGVPIKNCVQVDRRGRCSALYRRLHEIPYHEQESFSRDIKTAFEAHNKIYSFIVVVNKLDLMYLSEEKKSAVRFIDFLRSRLKTPGYSGFIVLGISALQYFYAQKVLNIKECADLNTDDGEAFRICINALLERYQGRRR